MKRVTWVELIGLIGLLLLLAVRRRFGRRLESHGAVRLRLGRTQMAGHRRPQAARILLHQR